MKTTIILEDVKRGGQPLSEEGIKGFLQDLYYHENYMYLPEARFTFTAKVKQNGRIVKTVNW